MLKSKTNPRLDGTAGPADGSTENSTFPMQKTSSLDRTSNNALLAVQKDKSELTPFDTGMFAYKKYFGIPPPSNPLAFPRNTSISSGALSQTGATVLVSCVTNTTTASSNRTNFGANSHSGNAAETCLSSEQGAVYWVGQYSSHFATK